MKKTMLFSSALVALAMLASCQKEELFETPATTTGVTEFTATIESTKTVIGSDGKVTWEKGDEITVTDAESKSAVYVAASDGASTKFTPKDEKTTVGSGPYTATYGNITKQVYDKDGANCPLSAETNDASSKTLHFSSPYAVLKVTAESSNSDVIKTVVVTYGDNGSFLDCGNGVTLTNDGVVFYVAVQPANAELSVAFYRADGKVATKTRTEPISLAVNDLLPVKFESLNFGTDTPTFKAVYNTTGTLTFYYDTDEHNEDGNTVYKGSDDTNYLFDDAKSQNQKWGYYRKRQSITNVKIDPSVAGYKDLTSTTFMFYNMQNVTSISGAEYLDISNVTDMSYMFANFGNNIDNITFNVVPDVSGWDTGNVTSMAGMFNAYGKQSKVLAAVPKVKDWNTEKVENMSSMFNSYGYGSNSFNDVPIVSDWDTGNVTNMSSMFYGYGYKSTALEKVPAVSDWKEKTGKVENMSSMFQDYGHDSGALIEVPDVSKWETDSVTNMSGMFYGYGYKSTALEKVPVVREWETGSVIKMDQMFDSYGYSSTALTEVPEVNDWDTGEVTDWSGIFQNYGYTSTVLATVPDVSDWKTSSVLEIDNMFYEYGYKSKVIVCNLDLSGWDLSNVTQAGLTVFQFKAKTFNVTIPAKTGTKENDSSHWYYGNGALHITPAGNLEEGSHSFKFN